MDEKMKHRLIGAAVLIALITLILPVIVKKPGVELQSTRVARNDIPVPPKQPTVKPSPVPNINLPPQTISRDATAAPVTTEAVTTEAVNNEAINAKKNQLAVVKPSQQTEPQLKLSDIVIDAPQQAPSHNAPAIPAKQPAKINGQQQAKKTISTSAISVTKPAREIVHAPVITKLKAANVPEAKATPKIVSKSTTKVATKTATKANWAIQLASFSERENAKVLHQRLQKMGYPVYLRQFTDHKGKHLTQVFIGPEPERDTAEKIMQKLKRTLKINGYVVRYYS